MRIRWMVLAAVAAAFCGSPAMAGDNRLEDRASDSYSADDLATLQRTAARGDAQAMYDLAMVYREGEGAPKDLKNTSKVPLGLVQYLTCEVPVTSTNWPGTKWTAVISAPTSMRLSGVTRNSASLRFGSTSAFAKLPRSALVKRETLRVPPPTWMAV